MHLRKSNEFQSTWTVSACTGVGCGLSLACLASHRAKARGHDVYDMFESETSDMNYSTTSIIQHDLSAVLDYTINLTFRHPSVSYYVFEEDTASPPEKRSSTVTRMPLRLYQPA